MSKKRKRRVFDASFRLEAVRRYEERRALQVPASVIAQDLGVGSVPGLVEIRVVPPY